MSDSRTISAVLQSLGKKLPQDQRAAYTKQVKGTIDNSDPADIWVQKFLSPDSYFNEEIHHRVGLGTLQPLYEGLNEEQAFKLTALIEQATGKPIGNSIWNLMTVPKKVHQGGIHVDTRNMGLEYHSNRKPEGIIYDIIEAGTVPDIGYRAHVGSNFINKYLPQIDDALNDQLTSFHRKQWNAPNYGDISELYPTRMAGDILRSVMQEGNF